MRKYLRVFEATEGVAWDVYACVELKTNKIYTEKLVGRVWVDTLNTYVARDSYGQSQEFGSLIFALNYFETRFCQ